MRRVAGMVFCVGLGGCVGINAEWQEDSATEQSSEDSQAAELDDTSPSELVCHEGAPAQGPCPDGCDCVGGECRILCNQADCRDRELACPSGWPCRIVCIDKDSCKNSQLHCTGAGSCAIDCVNEHACENVQVVCADGPCTVSCDHLQQPCTGMTMLCGARDSEVECAVGNVGVPPQLVELPSSGCACTSNCGG